MPVTSLYSFLCMPAKGADKQPKISGAIVTASDTPKLFDLLSATYAKAPDECDIEICFNNNDKGAQQNDCLDLLWAHVQKPSLPSGRAIAARLQSKTTHRSKLGLLFIALGTEGGKRRLVLARYPADKGIVAEQHGDDLDVKFLERVFMKNPAWYKSALYEGNSKADFWEGKAIDNQLNNMVQSVSDYWIKEFLLSDMRTTGRLGTRRLAEALRIATQRSKSPTVRGELVAAATLAAKTLNRKHISPKEFAERYLTPEATAELKKPLKGAVFEERFQFNAEEFQEHAAYRAEGLDNGAVLMGPANEFEAIYNIEKNQNGRQTYTTTGKVTSQKLTKTQP